MIENFIEYMWYLLHTPLKKLKKALNKWYILCKVFGKRFDEAKEDILRARDEGMVATCSHEMLPVHGADRRLTRYEGEHPENFRSRIAMYEEICKLGGTNEGVLLAVRTLGYISPVLVRANDLTGYVHYPLDGSWLLDGSRNLESDTLENRWAEFYIIIEMDVDEEHPISLKILQKNVRTWKEVGAKDNYLFSYRSRICGKYALNTLRVLYRWKIINNWLPNTQGTGYPIQSGYHIKIQNPTEYKAFRYVEHNLIYLDGTWKLDGTRIIDAWKKTEVL